MLPTAPASSEDSSVCAAPTSTWNPTSFCLVFRLPTTVTAADDALLEGGDEDCGDVSAPPVKAPTCTSAPPPCALEPAAADSMRGVTASKVSLTVALRLICRVPSTILRTFSTSPPDSLMPMMFGCSASSTTVSAGGSWGGNAGQLRYTTG